MPDDLAPEPTTLWNALQEDILNEAERHFGQATDDLDARRITGNGLGAPLGLAPVEPNITRAITTSDIPAALRGPRWKPYPEDDMSYRLGAPAHAAIRCPKPDCNRLLINGEPCSCTWQDPAEDAHPLTGRPVIAFGENGRIIAKGIVTAVERGGDELQLTVTQRPA